MNEYWKLDCEKIVGIMREQELKRWWVAENAGVHKTTLRRWLSGDISKVEAPRVASLATTLNVQSGDIARRCV
jgi:hypothetical protein